MENTIKTLFIKQGLDIVGPRTSYGWADGIEENLLDAFKGKVSLYEMLVYFKADYAIVPTQIMAPWLKSLYSAEFEQEMNNTTTNVRALDSLDLGKYDLVITHDPFLRNVPELKQQYPNTVFAYILAEHTSWQLHSLGFEYDLFLDHTYNSGDEVVRLPQSLNMVYPRVPDTIYDLFGSDKTSIFVDYRSVGHFLTNGNNNVALNIKQAQSYLDGLDLGLPLEPLSENSLKPFMFGNQNSDAKEYYSKLSRSKYFVTIANRVGQAAFDAASAGALVIGNVQSKLHNMLCGEGTLVSANSTIDEVKLLIDKLESDNTLFKELLAEQQSNLEQLTVKRPIEQLTKAIQLRNESILQTV